MRHQAVTRWDEFAMAAGARSPEEASLLLWSGTAFPFARPRTIWYQLRHVVRHKVCLGDPAANCYSRRAFKVNG